MTQTEIKKAYQVIQRVAKGFLKPGAQLTGVYELEDLTQEVFTHFLEVGFFEKYDERVTSFEYFVAAAAKRHLIDITRKRMHRMVSLQTPIKGKDGSETTLMEMQEEVMRDQFSEVLLKQLIENCPDEQISPNYKLSWKELLGLLIEGLTPSEIHKKVGVSSGRICQLKNELFQRLSAELV